MSNFISICYETPGRSHESTDTPCQDKAYNLIDSHIGIIALCDGAGSARLSHYGAEKTSGVVANLIKKNFDKYFAEPEPSVVAKEILESINSELITESKTRTDELKNKAYNEIQKFLKKCHDELNSVHCNIDFDYKTELEDKIKLLDHDIKELDNTKEKSREDHKSHLTGFHFALDEYWQNYEERINTSRGFYIEILKKRHKNFLKKCFKTIERMIKRWWEKDDRKDVKHMESFCKSMQDSLLKESKELQGILDKIEHHINNIKTDKKEKIANIIEDLKQIGREILSTLKKVYKNISRDAKELQGKLKKEKDELEIQHGELHSHILKTKKKFKSIIMEFIQCYEKAIQREQELLALAIKDKKQLKNTIQSHIKEHDSLKQKLNKAKTAFNNKKEDTKKHLEQLKKYTRETFYKNSDIESIESNELQEALDSLEHTRKECLDFITNKLNKQNKDMEKIIKIDMKSCLEGMKEEIINSVCEPKDLTSTLLFAAIKGNQCLTGHLGDGAIGGLYGDKLQCISNPDNGEHANETYFVTTEYAEKVLKISKGNIHEKNITAFVLMSDGSTEGLYSKKDKKFIEALQKHILAIREGQDKDKKQKDIETLIEKVKNEKSYDDCSIAVLVKV
ncbi:protein phosphatase 2C domain-containing protein [Helicobacter trogontum]|uniref:PPM-type phosphatase domain-containing protein n=1 Tax=Helicobacter trogontum TaxID=50960 RepID=A0A4U8SF48_9HELI|nr:protein phosphatase 2C domain-containing protein [Helicobacter trogontum]TLD84771.1 hypothetical protein LS81_001865 [Helicobacter trogontum]